MVTAYFARSDRPRLGLTREAPGTLAGVVGGEGPQEACAYEGPGTVAEDLG